MSTDNQSPAALMVELIMQHPETGQTGSYRLERTQHRVPMGTTIRQLLRLAPGTAPQAPGVARLSPAAPRSSRAQDEAPDGADHGHDGGQGADIIQAIEAKALGLSRFGRRAWLDDPLRPDDRVEVLCPILADAKAARFARVAKARAERTDGRWGRRNVIDRQIRATKGQPER